jgi:hydroxymethylpyrimidine pyrophosphatase-like HAD family hydrolase
MKKFILVSLLIFLAGCQSAYYAAWEKVGVEKRDILVDRVEDAKDSQEDAQKQFSSALDEFSQLINFNGGELQDVYSQLKDEFEASEESASTLSNRINKVEGVAEALFDEWEDELEKYTNVKLKRESQKQLKDTQRRYTSLVRTMRKAESTMEPILSALRDNVLYLKHNLNASAIGALQGEFNGIKKEINQLVSEMNKAIAESNSFISSIKSNN